MTTDEQLAPPFVAIVSDVQNHPIALTVLDARTLETRLQLQLEDWSHFRPVSAGHLLIGHGFIISPAARMDPHLMAGWSLLPNIGYTAPVHLTDTVVGEPPATIEPLPDNSGLIERNIRTSNSG